MTDSVSLPKPIAPRSKPIPREGEEGLFRQSWYPICFSKDVGKGEVIGRGFLDGRVVVFRAADGVARVLSAYCPHVGADLATGKVVENTIQCPFHHWQYDSNGVCVKTGVGDPPPKGACLFRFPTMERWGIIWAFNGETPLYEFPSLPVDESECLLGNYSLPAPIEADPWVFAANTPDMQHLKAVHGVQFSSADPHDLIRWNQWGLEYDVSAVHQGGKPIEWRMGLRGMFFYRHGTYDGWWCAAITGFGIPYPGVHEVFGAYMVLKQPGAEERLAAAKIISERTIAEDRPVLNALRYRQGLLTAGDRSLAKYLTMIREWPRAHPSAPFIR